MFLIILNNYEKNNYSKIYVFIKWIKYTQNLVSSKVAPESLCVSLYVLFYSAAPAAAAALTTSLLVAFQQLQSDSLTSALYEWRPLNVSAEQRAAEQDGQAAGQGQVQRGHRLQRQWCSPQETAAPLSVTHLHHSHGTERVHSLESSFMWLKNFTSKSIIK